MPTVTNLNRPSVKGTTQAQPAGTIDTAPGADGSGDKTISY